MRMMKRKNKGVCVMLIAAFMLIGIFVFGQKTTVHAIPQTVQIVYGDVNSDGRINDTDSLLVNRHIAAQKSEDVYHKHPDWILNARAYTAADIDRNYKVDITDLLMIERHIAWYKGKRVSKIVTVTLNDNESTGRCYDCFPVIYDAKKGANYPYLPNMQKTGYTFQGWYTKKTGGEKISSSSSVKNTENHILYSRWSANSYRLFFDTNGGNSVNGVKEIAYGNSYGILPSPVRTGYIFSGWYTRKTGGMKVSSSTKMGAQNVTVYAQWKPVIPGKPEITGIKADSYNKITITWKAASNATGYSVLYKTAGGSWKKIATLGSSARSYSHVSSGKYPIKIGQTYVYTVRAYNSASGKWSSYDEKGRSSKTVPTTVKIKSASLNSKKDAVTVRWDKAYGGDRYYVYRKAGSGSTWKRIAALNSNIRSYTDKRPVKGKVNIYTVRMYNSKAKVYGEYNKKGVSVTVPVYPGKVRLAKISSSNNSVKITWKKTSNATHYKIYYKVPGGKWKAVTQTGAGTTSYIHKGLKTGKRYYYVVRAYNSRFRTLGSYDSSGWGITVKGTSKPKLGAPQIGEWKKTHDSVTCNCVNPHDGVTYEIRWKKPRYAQGYQVCYKTCENGIWHTSYRTTKSLKFSTSFSHIAMKMKVKVRAYQVINGRRVYGPWSREKTKTISYSGSNRISFKNLLGKVYEYKNAKYKFGIAFGKNNTAYLGVWNKSGTSSSYEDFRFKFKDGQSYYRLKGARNGYYYRINLIPYKNSVRVKIYCELSSFKAFNINANFHYTKNNGILDYTGWKEGNSSGNAKEAFENFMRRNYRGYYYAIVDAGYKKEKLLIVTTAFRPGWFNYKPTDHVGYPIYVYRYKNGSVRLAVNEQLTQSISAGPWYYYKNKLYTLARRGGYYRLDIFSSGYERKFVNSYSSTIFSDKNIVKLKKCS